MGGQISPRWTVGVVKDRLIKTGPKYYYIYEIEKLIQEAKNVGVLSDDLYARLHALYVFI